MLLGKSNEKLRLNPRKAWYRNLEEVTTDGDYSVSLVLKRSQPAFLMLLATGMSPVYPCHVSARDMRTRPIGTGPVQARRIQAERLHPLCQKPGLLEARPALSRRCRMVHHSEPVDPDTRFYRRQVRYELPVRSHSAVDARHQGPDIRRAMQLTIDRKSFIDIIAEGQGDVSGAMLTPSP